MTPEQYMMKRAEIVSEYMEEIDEHESAGEFGDAENARKWMRVKLRELDKGTLMVIARDIEWDTQLGGCPYFEGLPMEINEELDRRKGELCAAD